MALPAGRYGVTKNQLLKIKKLPMNTIKLIEELTEKFNLLVTALQGKADNSVIGTVEDGTNPTKSYSVGEHMIRNGKFCTVTVAVTTSSTWTLGSNYVEDTIADNLVKQEAFTITTNAGGLANLTNQNSRIILRIDSANSKICFPYRTTGETNNIIVFNNDMTVAANLEVTGTYYYI